ncbi:hypothetical protein Hypma_013861 [Hypsizygus marmoreus]|uniref:Uncharacterized protein n=1 Tax=Hypsizygus marmoreus TaxID=39966 RepID=A0A369KBI9_HYPMA|nr:hypothetical protein Hypma_013861 [Hypsizygus marmoreus]
MAFFPAWSATVPREVTLDVGRYAKVDRPTTYTLLKSSRSMLQQIIRTITCNAAFCLILVKVGLCTEPKSVEAIKPRGDKFETLVGIASGTWSRLQVMEWADATFGPFVKPLETECAAQAVVRELRYAQEKKRRHEEDEETKPGENPPSQKRQRTKGKENKSPASAPKDLARRLGITLPKSYAHAESSQMADKVIDSSSFSGQSLASRLGLDSEIPPVLHDQVNSTNRGWTLASRMSKPTRKAGRIGPVSAQPSNAEPAIRPLAQEKSARPLGRFSPSEFMLLSKALEASSNSSRSQAAGPKAFDYAPRRSQPAHLRDLSSSSVVYSGNSSRPGVSGLGNMLSLPAAAPEGQATSPNKSDGRRHASSSDCPNDKAKTSTRQEL